MESTQSSTKLISIIVPVLDERESLMVLAGEIRDLAEKERLTIELIFVDDGSHDNSWQDICRLATTDDRVRGIRFRRNFGKANALAAGFEAARGDIVFQMDGDLQDDPAEIPNFLAKLKSGFDLVNGWKRKRCDSWQKVWSSRIFNWMVGHLTGLKLHDHNCGFKCFRAEVVKEIQIYGELHRFIPVIADARGYRVAELEVHHRARRFGRSKYGTQRFINSFLDLLTVSFLTEFGQRPLHLLGGLGLLAFLGGALGLSYLAVYWGLSRLGMEGYGPIGQRPLLTYSLAGLVLGSQMLAIGFLAELMISLNMRTGHNYNISERTADNPTNAGKR